MDKYYRKIWRSGVWLAAILLAAAGCLFSGSEPGSGLIVYVGTDDNIFTIALMEERVVFSNSLPGLQIVIELLLSRPSGGVMEPKRQPSSLLNRMGVIW
jgi:hypothetical protein